MKKIDSYILKKYLTTFSFCLLLFTAIVVVIDISEKTDDFVKSKLPVSKIITDYYFGLVPRIDAMLFPLFVFIAVIFFTSKMAERSEVIAILASGVSFRRFLLPYWVGSIFLASFLWVVYQFVLPRANAICERFVGSLRRECLDHMLVIGELQLIRVLKGYVTYFHLARPHQGIAQQIPAPRVSPPGEARAGKVMAFPVLNGLHHDYRWAAA